MSVIDFYECLRARVNQMADEHLAMQEAIPNIPSADLMAYLDELEKHADKLSRLASRLDEQNVSVSDNRERVSGVGATGGRPGGIQE